MLRDDLQRARHGRHWLRLCQRTRQRLMACFHCDWWQVVLLLLVTGYSLVIKQYSTSQGEQVDPHNDGGCGEPA